MLVFHKDQADINESVKLGIDQVFKYHYEPHRNVHVHYTRIGKQVVLHGRTRIFRMTADL